MDKVVAITQFHGYVLVVTERGVIYKIAHDNYRDDVAITRVYKISLDPL